MNILKGLNDMAIFKHNNGSIEFLRENAKLWYTETSFKYICKMNFKNNLGLDQFELIINELDVTCLLDSIYQFLDYRMKDIIIPFNKMNKYIYFTFYFANYNYNLNIF